jgi:hypothetical protein
LDQDQEPGIAGGKAEAEAYTSNPLERAKAGLRWLRRESPSQRERAVDDVADRQCLSCGHNSFSWYELSFGDEALLIADGNDGNEPHRMFVMTRVVSAVVCEKWIKQTGKIEHAFPPKEKAARRAACRADRGGFQNTSGPPLPNVFPPWTAMALALTHFHTVWMIFRHLVICASLLIGNFGLMMGAREGLVQLLGTTA